MGVLGFSAPSRPAPVFGRKISTGVSWASQRLPPRRQFLAERFVQGSGRLVYARCKRCDQTVVTCLGHRILRFEFWPTWLAGAILDLFSMPPKNTRQHFFDCKHPQSVQPAISCAQRWIG